MHAHLAQEQMVDSALEKYFEGVMLIVLTHARACTVQTHLRTCAYKKAFYYSKEKLVVIWASGKSFPLSRSITW